MHNPNCIEIKKYSRDFNSMLDEMKETLFFFFLTTYFVEVEVEGVSVCKSGGDVDRRWERRNRSEGSSGPVWRRSFRSWDWRRRREVRVSDAVAGKNEGLGFAENVRKWENNSQQRELVFAPYSIYFVRWGWGLTCHTSKPSTLTSNPPIRCNNS